MERRKDTEGKGTKLPRDYLDLVENLFNKNFAKNLLTRKEDGKTQKEVFVAFGEIYPDEVLLAVSLQYPEALHMTTCYASVDHPPTERKKESGTAAATTA